MKKTLELEYLTDGSDGIDAFTAEPEEFAAERSEESDSISDAPARGHIPAVSFERRRLVRPASLIGSALVGAMVAALILQRSDAPVSPAVAPSTDVSEVNGSPQVLPPVVAPPPAAVASPPPAAVDVGNEPPRATAPRTSPAPAESTESTRAIQAALGRYRNAFNALDAGAVMEVWPTASESSLTVAFERLQHQEISFDRCQIDVTGAGAEATCTGTAFYRPRAGSRTAQVDRRRWTFSLLNVNDEWLIERVHAR